MKRRNLLLALGSLFGNKFQASSNSRFLLVVHLYVGNLPTNKANILCEKVLDHSKNSEIAADSRFIIMPQRSRETWIEVFPLDGQDKPTEAIEAFVYDMMKG